MAAAASSPPPPVTTYRSQPRGFRRLLPYVRAHRTRFLLGFFLVPVFIGIQLYIPQIYGRAIAELERTASAPEAPRIDSGFWLRTAGLLAGLWILYASLRFGSRYLQVGLSRYVEEDLRNDLFRHLQRLPQRWFDHARIGDLVSRSTQDIELIRFMAGPTMFFGLATILQTPGALILVFSISPLLGASVIVFFALVALGMRFALPQLAQKSRAVQDAQADMAAKAQEAFAGFRVLQAFAREGAEVRAFASLADGCRTTQVDMARSRALLQSTFVASGMIGPLVIILSGVAQGLPVSDLFEAYLYTHMLVWPLLIIGWVLQTWHRARAAADRLDEIFDVVPEPSGSSAATPVRPPLEPSLEARHLTFRYHEDRPPALENVSFRLEPRQVLGLVGPIGSGKSTLVGLLARLYDPPRGALFVGGVDVCDLPLDELRRHLSVAPQDPFLFSDTLRNNILFGAATVTDDGDLSAAVRASQLESDLGAFRDAIDQMIGERGVTLSGGQKQRASLARALLAASQILVLDDTLSAVDHDTEQRILRNLRDRRQQQTTIIIAHRLEAVRHADLVLVLDGGRVVDHGTHEALLARGGWYARTWEQQNKEPTT